MNITKQKIISLIAILFILSISSGCALFKKDKPTFSGPWGNHAQHAWNVSTNSLKSHGIHVNKPSRLSTSFKRAEGTLGGGSDRLPYFLMNGNKIGGYLRGYCNGNATSVLAQEASGWWNVNIGTHETGHHVNNHALCDNVNNGHPDYMRTKGGMPHWPYWRGSRSIDGPSIRTFHYEENGEYVCLFYVEEEGIRADQEKSLKIVAKEILSDKMK